MVTTDYREIKTAACRIIFLRRAISPFFFSIYRGERSRDIDGRIAADAPIGRITSLPIIVKRERVGNDDRLQKSLTLQYGFYGAIGLYVIVRQQVIYDDNSVNRRTTMTSRRHHYRRLVDTRDK